MGLKPLDLFMRRVRVDGDGCWRFMRLSGGVDAVTFRFSVRGKYYSRASRTFAWVAHKGPMRPRTWLKPRCGNAKCVNPEHQSVIFPAYTLRGFEQRIVKNSPEKIWSVGTSTCWIWQWASTQGYGLCNNEHGLQVPATHVALKLYRDITVPKGMFACHTCDVPMCVNPDHLYVGTAKDNMDDRRERTANRGAPGEKNRAAVLTEDEVIQIFTAYRDRTSNLAQLYEAFPHVGPSGIRKVVYRERWRHVTDSLV